MPKQAGFTFVETIIGVAVFLIIGLGVYQGFAKMFDVVRLSRIKITATALANEQLEIIRNLPYSDVGLIGGIPVGKITPTQTLVRDNNQFTVITAIRNIDDTFDGTIGGSPNDLSPADYKLVEVTISCLTCRNFQPLSVATHVAPKNLETASANGALFIRVFDANGQPIQGASVHIENNQVGPSIIINDTTSNSGMLQIVDAPPGVEAYEITVSKTGYSTERTYPTGGAGNPNPTKPHATVILQQVTQVSFAIDRLSTINVSSLTPTCGALPDIDFSLKGSKLIGVNPDVLKYDQDHITDVSGNRTISNLEWDTYNPSITDASYDLAGSIPLIPLNLAPGSSQDLKLILEPKNPSSLLVTVKDAASQLPITDASVTLEKTGYQETKTTARGFLAQTDWSGGEGQADFVDPTRYFSSDGNIATINPGGELRLNRVLGQYQPSGWLISSTFDIGSAGNFHEVSWQPQDQPLQAGLDSVRIQMATNNDKTTWNFLGPDGTANTFYTVSGSNINSVHNGNRYLRYKVLLETANSAFTPNISDFAFTFTSSCIPPGQVLFSGLAADDYSLGVSRSGYQTFSDTVTVSSPWQQREVLLVPQ